MNESPITFQNRGELISGIQHIPENQETKNASIVVFLHGFAGYRIGPHRFFVKLARQLTESGYVCIRFDFRGRGYSEGKREETSYKTMVSDLDVVLDDIHKRFTPKRLILIGICSGTRTALYYIKNKINRVDALISLSSPPLTNISSVTAATTHTRSVLGEYVHKARSFETWRRLFQGDINTKMVTRIISKTLLSFWYAIKTILFRTGSKNYTKPKRKLNTNPFPNFRGEVFLIHGEKDPDTPMAVQQISLLLSGNSISYQTQIIKGANHSFYSLKWEKEIIQIIKDWLFEKFPLVE
jgi:pimeloyl-ACP methyl ester carboxylesterase